MKLVSKFSFLFLFLFLFLSSQGQTIKVISSEDLSPLPYASVTNHSKPFFISANKEGIAILHGKEGDTISVSYIGYKTAILHLSSDSLQMVRLIRDAKRMAPVTIKTCKKPVALSYINFEEKKNSKKKTDTNLGFGGVVLGMGESGNNNQIAVLFNPSESNVLLSEFSFWIEKYNYQAPPSWVYTPLLISFYEVAEKTNLPGELISQKPLFHFPKKSGKQNIKLDSLYISIPPEGIYISLQYVMSREYRWEFRTNWRESETDRVGKDTVFIMHGGLISGTRSEGFDYVYINIQNQWTSPSGRPVPGNKVQSTIKCEAVIKYCKEK